MQRAKAYYCTVYSLAALTSLAENGSEEVLNTCQSNGDGETPVDSPALGILLESVSVFLIYDTERGCLPDNPQSSRI